MRSTIDASHIEELRRRHTDGDIDRRTLLGLLGIAGLASGVVGGPLRALAQSASVKEIKLQGWGGVVQEAVRRTAVRPFEQATGIKVIETTAGLEEEMLAKARAGRPGDFHMINSAGIAWYKRWIDAGFGVVLNESNIPNIKNVMPALIAPLRKVTPQGLSAIPVSYGNTGIAYNKKYISPDKAAAEREKLLLDLSLKGRLSGHNDFQTRMWVAAVQSGQDPNNIRDLDLVWDTIRTNRNLVKKYWGSGAESTELLSSEEVYASDIWSGRAASLMERNKDIGYVDFSKGYCWLFDLLVLKGSPIEVCEQFINFFLEPEVTIAVAEAQLYPPPLDPTKVTLTERIKGLPNFDPTGTLAQFAFTDPDYWTLNEKDWKPKYSRIEKGF